MLTVIVALPDLSADVAVIVAAPVATAVTVADIPDPLTVATLALLVVHTTAGEGATPFDVTTVAESDAVAPIASSTSASGVTDTDVTVGGTFTSTAALPDFPDADAVIVAEPFATAVTVTVAPAPATVATEGLLDIHSIAGDGPAPDIVTVAVSDEVAPMATRLAVAGETVTDVTVATGGCGSEGPPTLGERSPPPQE